MKMLKLILVGTLVGFVSAFPVYAGKKPFPQPPAGQQTEKSTGGTPSAQPVGGAATGETTGGSYQCFVGTKDGGVQTTTVQAESENAAKVAAVKQFGSRAFGLMSVQCTPGAAAPGASGGALILSKNSQLSKIPDWPKGTGVGEPSDCNKDAMQESLDNMRKRGETAYRCVVFQGKFGGQPWESGSGELGLYQLQLHPNSPMVWRVYKRDQTHLIALVAEFDKSGKLLSSQSARSPTNLLAAASGTQSTDNGKDQTNCDPMKGERVAPGQKGIPCWEATMHMRLPGR